MNRTKESISEDGYIYITENNNIYISENIYIYISQESISLITHIGEITILQLMGNYTSAPFPIGLWGVTKRVSVRSLIIN